MFSFVSDNKSPTHRDPRQLCLSAEAHSQSTKNKLGPPYPLSITENRGKIHVLGFTLGFVMALQCHRFPSVCLGVISSAPGDKLPCLWLF